MVRYLSAASLLCPSVISAGECLHAHWLHSARNWHCDQWSGLSEKCWEPLLLYNCLWVFYTPPGRAGWKASTLHHVMYASKLREIRCLLSQNLQSALYRGKIVFLLLEAGYTALLPVISDLGVIWSQMSGEGVVLDDTVFIQVRDL